MTDIQSLATGHSRREFLTRLGLMTGGAVSLSLLAACGEKAKEAVSGPAPGLQAFSQDQFDLVDAVAEAIIPETDTPGARGAGVPHVVDELVANWMKPDEGQAFLAGLTWMADKTKNDSGAPFHKLDMPAQSEALDRLGAEMGEQWEGREHPYRTLRELVIFAYYTSEPGASEELIYDPVPGPFQGCVDFEQAGGRAWARQG